MNENQQALVQAEEKLLEAMRNSQVKDLDQLLHPDLKFTIPSGDTLGKEDDLKSHADGVMTFDQLTHENPQFTWIDDLAIVVVDQYIKGDYSGFPIDARFRYERVWKHTDKGWQVVAGAAVQKQPAP
ncbi:nuclear transport factor 2 family protein [bacterium SCSIO 12741]|nr:nuclear transport factor 2 family protein [bacterium SCSIO 12741]